VTDNRITILAETREFLHEIDRERAGRARSHAEEKLSNPDLRKKNFLKHRKKLFRAIARLENS